MPQPAQNNQMHLNLKHMWLQPSVINRPRILPKKGPFTPKNLSKTPTRTNLANSSQFVATFTVMSLLDTSTLYRILKMATILSML